MRSLGLILIVVAGTLGSRFSDVSETAALQDGGAPVAAIDDPWGVAGAFAIEAVTPAEFTDLHNVVHLGERIIAGGEPLSPAALERIRDLGVKTLLSVDGKAPDQETAARLGMRYVHVPIEYSGITQDEMLRIAKTFYELEGPFYVHCFHGKHRGPAAAAIGRIILDQTPRDRALAEMRQWCGTSDQYLGLYDVVGNAALPTREEAARFAWDFPARHQIGGFRQAMAELARVRDALALLAEHDWQPDPSHPDLDSGNQAEKLVALLEQSVEHAPEMQHGDDFERPMRDSVAAGRELRSALSRAAAGESQAPAAASMAFRDVLKSCASCHAEYRNR